MIPFFEFSKRLAKKGIQISFISTARNLQRLPPVPPGFADKIRLVEISLPSVDVLLENCEATVDLELEQVQYLKKACDGLQAPFENLMHVDLPDLILFDFVQCWIPETAAKFGVPCAFFSAYSASMLAFMEPPNVLKSFNKRTKAKDLTTAPEWFHFPSLVSYKPDQAAVGFQSLRIPDKSSMSTGQIFTKTLECCDFVAVRSSEEFEGEYLDLLKKLYHKPALAICLMPPKLPSGILAQTSNQRVVCLGWSPQLEILAHAAIGGCLFHSGWATIIESLGFGHPQILIPMIADQGLNAKLLVVKGIGFELARNEDGSFN